MAFVAVIRPHVQSGGQPWIGGGVQECRPKNTLVFDVGRRSVSRRSSFRRSSLWRIAKVPSAVTDSVASPPVPDLSVPTSPRGVGSGSWILRGLVRLAAPFYTGKRRGIAYAWSFLVVFLALISTLYAVGMSFILRMFWNALSSKDAAKFGKILKAYTLAVVMGPVILCLFEWAKGRLALAWRNVLTTSLVEKFLHPSSIPYYAVNQAIVPGIDNADQRLSDDIRSFCERAVRFMCVFSVAIFDLAVFSVVLYKVYPPLFGILVAYAVGGTVLLSLYGRPLVGLNAAQVMREGNLRFSLLRVRDNSESIAFYGGEKLEEKEILERLRSLVQNSIRLLGMNRNVSFLGTSHRYWIQVVPNFILAPVFFSGEIAMGTISQALYAFNHVLSSTSLVVTEFVAISEFAAGVRRLSQLSDAIRDDTEDKSDGTLGIDVTAADSNSPPGLSVRNLCLQTPNAGLRQPLVQNLSFDVKPGQHLLVTGQSGIGKTSLLRAIAGLWKSGAGSIEKPSREQTLFLSQKPFITLGTLRQNVLYPVDEEQTKAISDDEVLETLSKVNLGKLVRRVGGLHVSGEELGRKLSIGEQQRLAFARIVSMKPKFVVLDEATSALDEDNERDMYRLIKELGATCISVGNRATLSEYHDVVLNMTEEGMWQLSST